MWKKKKVKAGVLLYAVTIAAIFSLLLQFYLNRQIAHYQDYALNKEKLVAFAMAKRTKDKAEQESGEQVFNLGQVRLKLIMNTILKMEGQIVKSMIKAFTMLESLLVLGLVSILALGLSSSVQSTFAAVEEQIFFMEFEELYRETQKRSVASQQKTSLNLDGQTLSNGSQKLTVPKGIQAPSGQSITFDRAGGNSSLAKVEFQTSKGAIRYQLYLGNGKIKRIKETKN
ncbi:competence protein CglD [Streptococcus pneumoniae]|nr:competence protein CglD [Streptococcus pneumoniae]